VNERIRVSLGSEVDEIRDAVEAARLVASVAREDAFPDSHSRLASIAAMSAVHGALSLVSARLRLLSDVVRGGAEPALLRAAHNHLPLGASGSEDLILEANRMPQPVGRQRGKARTSKRGR
jgi:hypothetical protein